MLSKNNKRKLIQAAKSVYWSYLSLEFVNKSMLPGEQSLSQQLDSAIRRKDFHPGVTLGGKIFQVQITAPAPQLESKGQDSQNIYEISFDDAASKAENQIRHLNSYSTKQKRNIITRRKYKAQLNPVTGQYVLGTELEKGDKKILVGGLNKKSLYASHIANLGIFIEKLQKSSQQGAAMLAALATGSGKSFTQALWILVLYLADLKGVFAAPKNLVPQLKKDVQCLLPDLVSKQIALEENEEKEEKEHKEEEKKGENPVSEKPFRIISHDALFLNDFTKKMQDFYTPDCTILSVDEQHLINRREDWSVKLRHFVSTYNAIFLTATPKKDSYKLSGNKSTVAMSRKQKEKAGYAIPAENIQKETTDFSTKIDASKDNWFMRKMYKLMSSFANALVSEVSSPVDETLRRINYNFLSRPRKKNQDLQHFLRWNIALPNSEKTLFITHDHDTLINLVRGLNDENTATSIYKDGTLVERRCIYDLFEIREINEDRITDNFNEKRRALFKKRLNAFIKKSGFKAAEIDNAVIEEMTKASSMKEQANKVIYTNIVNIALRLLTGYDNITLDKMRYENLDNLYAEVMDKLVKHRKTIEELTQAFQTNDGLDPETAKKLAMDVDRIIVYLKTNGVSKDEQIKIIDNWTVHAASHIENIFMAFDWQSYYTRFVFEGLEKNHEAAIQDNVVYSGFEHTQKPLRLEDGSFNPENKKRQHNAVEIFDERMVEHSYAPISDNKMTTEQMKAAFKMGLIPFVIGNTMVEGFNDPNLERTVNIVAKTSDPSNQPDKIIQASGRNRCLNPYKISSFLQVVAKGVQSVFHLKSLDKMDYVPDFLKGTEKYNQLFLEAQGKKMAIKVKQWIYEQLEIHGCIETQAINKYVFDLAKESLLELNKTNDHDIHSSRKQFVKVLDSLHKELDQVRYKIRNTYELSSFVKFIGNTLNSIAQYVYSPFREKAYKNLTNTLNNLGSLENTHPKLKLYHKIVGGDFALLQKNGMTFNMLANVLKDQKEKIKKEVEKDQAILFDEDAVIDTLKRNMIDAVKAAQHGKNGNTFEIYKAFIKSIIAKDNKELMEQLKSLEFEELKAEDPRIRLPVTMERTLALIQSDKNSDFSGLYNRLGNVEKANLGIHLADKLRNNTAADDIKPYANISKCQHYPILRDLVHSPVFLRLMGDTLRGFNIRELRLFLSQSPANEELPASERTPEYRVKAIIEMLRALHTFKDDPDKFDDIYLKYYIRMTKSKQILDDIGTIFKLQLDCHLYFHQINKKGQFVLNQQLPPFFNDLQDNQKGILSSNTNRVSTNNKNTFAQKATRIFFLKAIKDSLVDMNEINNTIQSQQDAQVVHVAQNLVAPLRQTLNKTWKWTLFGKCKNPSQQEAKGFGQKLNAVKPLDTARAEHQEHCLVSVDGLLV